MGEPRNREPLNLPPHGTSGCFSNCRPSRARRIQDRISGIQSCGREERVSGGSRALRASHAGRRGAHAANDHPYSLISRSFGCCPSRNWIAAIGTQTITPKVRGKRRRSTRNAPRQRRSVRSATRSRTALSGRPHPGQLLVFRGRSCARWMKTTKSGLGRRATRHRRERPSLRT